MTGTARYWVGTYPADGPEGRPGTGEAIWRLEPDPVTGALAGVPAAPSPAPSFLAVGGDGRTLYAVGETAPGTVTRFEVTADGGLVERERVGSGGDHPCHLLVHPGGRALYVTNYGGGELAVLTLEPDGAFSGSVRAAGGPDQVFGHAGRGPDAGRQEGPHAHSALLDPAGRVLIVADLGTDELRRFRVASDGRLAEDGVALTLPPGTGPRHMALGPGGHVYLVGELSVTVHVLAWTGDGGLRAGQVLPACDSPLLTGRRSLPAHVAVAQGQVLVSVRGPDVVAAFAVHDDGARLEHVRDLPVGGGWPRHFAVAEGRPWLVVAVQNAGRVVALGREPAVGAATAGVCGMVEIPFPACIAG